MSKAQHGKLALCVAALGLHGHSVSVLLEGGLKRKPGCLRLFSWAERVDCWASGANSAGAAKQVAWVIISLLIFKKLNLE